jgi:hypothetical protein
MKSSFIYVEKKSMGVLDKYGFESYLKSHNKLFFYTKWTFTIIIGDLFSSQVTWFMHK